MTGDFRAYFGRIPEMVEGGPPAQTFMGIPLHPDPTLDDHQVMVDTGPERIYYDMSKGYPVEQRRETKPGLRRPE